MASPAKVTYGKPRFVLMVSIYGLPKEYFAPFYQRLNIRHSPLPSGVVRF